MSDLTLVYYSANVITHYFAATTLIQVKRALDEAGIDPSIVSVTQEPMNLGRNIVFKPEVSHLNIYRQALIGAREANTKYIALIEDDVLYSPDHFKYRPKSGVFAYNMSVWSIYTWVKPALFSYKDRRNLGQLICERDLFIEAMEERFNKYPDDTQIDLGIWAEPGKYEDHLKVTRRESEKFYTDIPNIAFSHETALSYKNLGKRKKLGNLRVTALPYWGTAEEILKLYV